MYKYRSYGSIENYGKIYKYKLDKYIMKKFKLDEKCIYIVQLAKLLKYNKQRMKFNQLAELLNSNGFTTDSGYRFIVPANEELYKVLFKLYNLFHKAISTRAEDLEDYFNCTTSYLEECLKVFKDKNGNTIDEIYY